MTAPLRVLVTVDEPGLGRLSEVVAALRAAGLVVDTVLTHVGVVTGLVAPADVPAVRAVGGIEQVEVERDDWDAG
ncbi:hypothetical protein [Actinokineospora bangkokensis]|uniref:ACT domain-containing protein n=1 Tax=Actinokineospora bangkokensis TaxID=1193682 RepID=A0A1Q9LPX1_9PSEU|nr:hypothetical protein [Actinokineospora bangkokensis]OLR94069.1 hypothetical protein BJP25_13945 [Actinokineospora bangkokensis]